MEEFMEQYGNVVIAILVIGVMAGSLLQGGVHGMADVMCNFMSGLLA